MTETNRIVKTFEFPTVAEDESRSERPKIEVGTTGNLEQFTLKDLAGVELLEAMAAASVGVRGVMQFLYRAIEDDDWERFKKATATLLPKQFTDLVGDLIDLYAAFPTTPGDGSSTG